MAEKVEVVIKIPKYYLKNPQDYAALAECVRRGTPLPKGHGVLVDADEIVGEAEKICTDDFREKLKSFIRLAPPIIEADRNEEEEV